MNIVLCKMSHYGIFNDIKFLLGQNVQITSEAEYFYRHFYGLCIFIQIWNHI